VEWIGVDLKQNRYLLDAAYDYDPDCPQCNYGYVQNQAGLTVVCECVKKKRAFRKIMELNEKYAMPPKLREKSFENFVVHTKRQEQALRAVRSGKSCYLFGKWGAGKTHLMAAMVNELQRQLKPALLISAPWLFESVRRDIFNNWEIGILEDACTVEYLAIDDVGKEKTTEMVEEKLFMIVDRRLNEGKATSFSSNFPLEDSDKKDQRRMYLDQAIRSRIYEMCELVYVDGPDYRKEKKGNVS